MHVIAKPKKKKQQQKTVNQTKHRAFEHNIYVNKLDERVANRMTLFGYQVELAFPASCQWLPDRGKHVFVGLK